ncbi:hypothetical protein GOBAR_DD04087 [Gossypium barbadense]|nr:hypothetical protein GOBAR_DD04087 [Gossypium barbadense]
MVTPANVQQIPGLNTLGISKHTSTMLCDVVQESEIPDRPGVGTKAKPVNLNRAVYSEEELTETMGRRPETVEGGGLNIPGITSNQVGSMVTPANVQQIPGLNTLGISKHTSTMLCDVVQESEIPDRPGVGTKAKPVNLNRAV